eukprot:scaffold17170_cov62-Phaeocystis_antarctica.AAC.4
MCGGKVQRLGERHQPESRLFASRLLAPLRPARHYRVLGARRLLLITPRVAQKGGHFPHRCRFRALVERRPCWWRSRHVVGEVRGVQPASKQAPEELRGAFERGVGITAADERRDRRRLLRLGAAPTQAPQAAVDAATIAGRGEGGTQEEDDAQDRKCHPCAEVAASLDVVCDADYGVEHAEAQEKEAADGPQPPQGGARLHGALAAAAQRGGERAGGGEAQRGTQEANCIGMPRHAGECCDNVERAQPRAHDEASGDSDADRVCVGGEEGEEEQAPTQRGGQKPPKETANGGLDRLARLKHDVRSHANQQERPPRLYHRKADVQPPSCGRLPSRNQYTPYRCRATIARGRASAVACDTCLLC